VLLLFAFPVLGDDIASGPKKDEKVPTLTIHDVTGPNKGKEIDIVKDRGDKPTVYLMVWSDKFGRPMFQYMKTLQEKVKTDLKDRDVALVAVWLTEDAEKTADFLPKISQYFGDTTLTYCKTDRNGPNNWGINTDAHLTAIVVNKGKTVATFAYASLNATDVPKVTEAIDKATKK